MDFWDSKVKLLVISTLFVVTTSALINTQCTTPNRKTGICVQYSKCYELQQLVASRDLHKIRFVQASQCGFLFEAYVCCPNLQIQEVGGDEFCLQNDLNKITGGKKTEIGEFRWMAQLQYKINGQNRNVVLCAGSIINKRFILTAAHCLDMTDQTLQYVILGEWDTRSNPDIENGIEADPIQTYKVKKWIQHEDYDTPNKFDNDIGLVEINKDIVYSDWIKPSCVPNSANLKYRDLTGHELIVSGWGRTSGRIYASGSPVKLKAVISGTSKRYCQNEYRYDASITISDKHFCAFKRGVDACRGDSGGPVMGLEVVNDNVYLYIAGIVSFGPNRCGSKTIPGVYTRVASYISWIKENME